jgi:hypothetical protein
MHGVMDKIDFLVRFWELKARSARLGNPLGPAEQLELLSLLQLVTGDGGVPDPGPVARERGAIPAQVIGDGAILSIEIRAVSAAAILVACASGLTPGAQVIMRVADAVSGVEYALPCEVAWAYAGTPTTMALIVDGIPTRAEFAAPPLAHTHASMRLGPRVRLVG